MNIYIKNALKVYNNKVVLHVDNLEFEEGCIYALMGLNGSGKTTLLQCSSGLEAFTCGEVLYDGKKDIEAVRRDISVMPQKPYMFNGSVLDNIKLGLGFRKSSMKEIEIKLKKYLPYFDIEHILYENAKKLSGGEQAKTALLRTAVLETPVSFLDEPTASMDIEGTLSAESLIRGMASEKRTVVLVTHDLYQAERLADYVIFLDKGKIIERGEKLKVFHSPESTLVKQILKRGEGYDKNSNTNCK